MHYECRGSVCGIKNINCTYGIAICKLKISFLKLFRIKKRKYYSGSAVHVLLCDVALIFVLQKCHPSSVLYFPLYFSYAT